MLLLRPVAESAGVQVLLIDTLTYSWFLPGCFLAITFRCIVSRVLKKWRLSLVKIGDDELDMQLLISLVKARPVLWDKTGDVYKDGMETKKT